MGLRDFIYLFIFLAFFSLYVLVGEGKGYLSSSSLLNIDPLLQTAVEMLVVSRLQCIYGRTTNFLYQNPANLRIFHISKFSFSLKCC